MLELISMLYKRKLNQIKTQALQEEAEAKIMEAAAALSSDLVVDRPDTAGWIRRYQVNDWEKGHLQANQLEVVRKAREFDRWDPHAHGILNTLMYFIMGRGLQLQPKSEDLMITYVWREFFTAERNKMALKQFEIVRRPFRDGEVFIHVMDKDENDNHTGKSTIRFIDPLLVRHATDSVGKIDDDPIESIKNGVVTNPEDVEDVIAYQVLDRVDRTTFHLIPADEMIHVKINADSDEKRGEPGIQTLLHYFRHYEQWLENRIILNKMRSAIVMVRSVQGTPTEVQNLSKTLPLAQRNSSNEQKRQNFRGGTVITAGPNVKYEMLAPNINATDVKEDGRNIKLAMAAGMSSPEYIWGDSSNANYASTMIAESPFVKMIQYWQIFFEFHFQRLFKKVVENAVKGGLLEEPNDEEFVAKLQKVRAMSEAADPSDPDGLSPKEQAIKELMPDGRMETPTEIFYGCDITWPEVIHRDIKEQLEALALARQNGWVADPTASAAIGYDYSEEVRKQRKIEEDAEIEDNPLLHSGGQGDAGDMHDEMSSLMDQLTPEDKNTILTSKDPKQVHSIIQKYQANGNGVAAGAGGPNKRTGGAADDPPEEGNE